MYAGGSGEDENRLILSVGNTAEGLNRREGWASLNGVSDVDMLRLGAERKLSPRKDSVTAELLDSGLCRYGRDYDLGDVVTVVADDRQRNARLTAVEETYEDGKRTLKATFGEGPVTLTGLIRERVAGEYCLERRCRRHCLLPGSGAEPRETVRSTVIPSSEPAQRCSRW